MLRPERVINCSMLMLDYDGRSVVIMTDPFWYNRLLLELDYDADDVNAGRHRVVHAAYGAWR